MTVLIGGHLVAPGLRYWPRLCENTQSVSVFGLGSELLKDDQFTAIIAVRGIFRIAHDNGERVTLLYQSARPEERLAKGAGPDGSEFHACPPVLNYRNELSAFYGLTFPHPISNEFHGALLMSLPFGQLRNSDEVISHMLCVGV